MTIEDITKQFCRDLETAIRADVEAKIRAAFSAPAEKVGERKRAAKKATNASAGHPRVALGTADEIAHLCRTRGTINRSLAQETLGLSRYQWEVGIRAAVGRGLVVQSGSKRGTVYSLPPSTRGGVAA